MRESTESGRASPGDHERGADGHTSQVTTLRGRGPAGRDPKLISPDAAPMVQPGVLATMARTWPVSTALVLVGVGGGLGLAWHTPDVYTAETRLSVGSQELSAQAVPGYVLALQTMTSNYARYIKTTDRVRADLTKSLGPSARAVVDVTASPIPESNILRLEISSTDPRVAVRAVDLLGRNVIDQVARGASTVDPALRKLTDASNALASATADQAKAQKVVDDLQTEARPDQTEVDVARAAVVTAQAKVLTLTVEQQAEATAYRDAYQDSGQSATLSVIRPGAITLDDGMSTMERQGALGLIAGAALAVGLAYLRDKRAQRRRRRDAAAFTPRDHGAESTATSVEAHATQW